MTSLRFRRFNAMEHVRQLSFVGLVVLAAFLGATNIRQGRQHDRQIDVLFEDIEDLRAIVRTLVGKQTDTPTNEPIVITIPADPTRGVSERVIVIPSPTTTSTNTTSSSSTTSSTSTSSTTSTSMSTTTTTTRPLITVPTLL